MPPTTTTTTQSNAYSIPRLSLEATLADYKLHHSRDPSPPDGNDQGRTLRPNVPQTWDTTHRRVPPPRRTNRNRDPLETRVYNSAAERIFITVMFTGVLINASAAKAWRWTFGELGDGFFRYRIGGEI
ncbi:hypothetical protein VTK73DRAFT_7129 [Phialemonium thermophilum]|uniref:Uncharacterized protein n=1 Tax=Phialemonium thermophilum TaxID=223376 RepID=A0ABR3WG62_9PEZI